MSRKMGARRMEEAVRAYFARCDGTKERVPQKGGGFSERQIPYTLYGLARAAKVTPEALVKVVRAPRRTAKDRLLFDAVLRVAAYTQERALLGELTYQVAIETLRTIGANPESEQTDAMRITMDESLSRYAR